MNLWELFSLQGTLFALMLIGAWLKRRGIVNENGRRCLTDLCINVVLPCNIFQSYLVKYDPELLKSGALLLAASVLMQVPCLAINAFLYNRCPPQRKSVLQFSTIVPNSGFLGNPIAEGIYGAAGVMRASFFLLPMRIMMWSVGMAYFTAGEKTDRRKVIRNVLTHPCLVAVYLGLLCMVTQVRLPRVLTETVRYVSACNSALSLFIVGMVLADGKPAEIFRRDTLGISALRLVLLPGIMFGIGRLLGLDTMSLGVSVLMIGMPAGALSAVFAARYGADAPFATRSVVVTTLLSMLTLPLWCWLIGT